MQVIKSNFIYKEHTGNQQVFFKNVISCEVYNNCTLDVYVNKLKIRPGQKSIIVRADYSIPDVELTFQFIPKVKVEENQQKEADSLDFTFEISDFNKKNIEVIPKYTAPEIRKSVVIYYKTLPEKNN